MKPTRKGLKLEPRKPEEVPETRLEIQQATAENIAAANQALEEAAKRYEMAKQQLNLVVLSVFSERGIKQAELVKVEGGSSPALIVKVRERVQKVS